MSAFTLFPNIFGDPAHVIGQEKKASKEETQILPLYMETWSSKCSLTGIYRNRTEPKNVATVQTPCHRTQSVLYILTMND